MQYDGNHDNCIATREYGMTQ